MKYPVVIEKGARNYGAFAPDVPGAVGLGDSREEALESVARGMALHLLDLAERGQEPPRPSEVSTLDLSEYEPEEPYEVVMCAVAPVNPVSLRIERAIAQAGLSEAEVARRAGTSRAAMTRITDPFYWGHSLATLNKIAEALGKRLEVEFKDVELKDAA
jgi:antitoxin HicB